MDEHKPQTLKPLDRYLSVVDVWAMAFGCMVGWGVFAMPGTTFLPVAGPLGTVCSMLIGTVIMLIIAGNLSYAVFSLVILAPWAFVGFEVTALRGCRTGKDPCGGEQSCQEPLPV